MKTQPVLFFDSGLGCVPYGHFFHTRNPGERLVCVSDRENFPYGPRSREELVSLLDSLTQRLAAAYRPKVLAVICNTASVSALGYLREKMPRLPIVGTVPAVKPAISVSKKRKVGVLGTERAVKDPYMRELAYSYGPDCEIIGTAAPELVEYVEHSYASSTPASRLETASFYIERFRAAGVDAVVLACTHFLLLLDEFRAAAGADISVHDSLEGVVRRVESILDADRLRTDSAYGGMPVLAVTGKGTLESYWKEIGARFGFSPEKFS